MKKEWKNQAEEEPGSGRTDSAAKNKACVFSFSFPICVVYVVVC